MKKLLRYIAAVILAMVGLLTLFLSSSIIFDWFGIREKEGNYVLFIVWANFICGMIYLVSSFGMMRARLWTVKLLVLAIVVLLVAYAGLFVHINAGGLYETKTIGAMAFRITVTAVLAGLGYFTLRKLPPTIG
jgi:hypothetical protein